MAPSGAYSERVRELFRQAAEAGSIGGVLFRGIGAVLLAIGSALASGILTLADVFIIPTQAFITEIGGLIESLIGGAATIVDFGAIASALSIGPGGLFASPLSFIFGIAIILGGIWLLLAFISEEPTTNFLPLIGTGFDVPTPGFTDAEEDDKND